ncbi:hypothetical protein [Neisseria zoodegmatis]|uniref:Uncharacterized protein n=1 Tax=Neisseria zoodegmatis TaxID=326523 RepID=A0AB38DRZ1_9NEIS|nr:hypothetical protein [Neisseria zoodegmatis]OSI10933.1 hypothetical protein BWD10_03200 [Neisseria zoodegmatis]SNU80170.1 Uncharacterised protein [Neisseria zoodegmatis]
MKPEWISLILSIFAVMFTYVGYRHQVKPSIKIIAVISGNDADTVVIELKRLKHGYHFYRAETISPETCLIYDYGEGNYTPHIPLHLIHSRMLELNYWINPESDRSGACRFWFTVSKNDKGRSLRLCFKNALFPYKSSSVIPIGSEGLTVI